MTVRFFPTEGGEPAEESGRLAPVTYLHDAARARGGAAVVPAAGEHQPLVRTASKEGQNAGEVAVQLLARRAMSRWEVEQALLRRGFDSEVIEPELDRLEQQGAIDDETLAETIVAAALRHKSQGRQALERELRRRHIDDETAAEALCDFDGEAEVDRAIEVATKRFAQLKGVDEQTAERRLWGYLARRGFSGEAICIAVGEALHPAE